MKRAWLKPVKSPFHPVEDIAERLAGIKRLLSLESAEETNPLASYKLVCINSLKTSRARGEFPGPTIPDKKSFIALRSRLPHEGVCCHSDTAPETHVLEETATGSNLRCCICTPCDMFQRCL